MRGMQGSYGWRDLEAIWEDPDKGPPRRIPSQLRYIAFRKLQMIDAADDASDDARFFSAAQSPLHRNTYGRAQHRPILSDGNLFGMEIPDEDLDAIAGGSWCSDHEWGCPAEKCGVYGIGR